MMRLPPQTELEIMPTSMRPTVSYVIHLAVLRAGYTARDVDEFCLEQSQNRKGQEQPCSSHRRGFRGRGRAKYPRCVLGAQRGL